MDNKLRVGVFMGGKSIEKEVSFNSGRTICDHLDTNRYEIVPLFQRANGNLYILPWKFLHRGKISDFEHRLDSEALKIIWDDLKNYVDFIYIACHGRFAEDGTLQGFFEILNIPYLGSKVIASALGMDKIIQKKILKSHGISIPKYISISPSEYNFFKNNENSLVEKLKEANILFPCIVKPYMEGSSLGISIAQNINELLSSILKAATIDGSVFQNVLIEELLTGMEFSCIIITDYKTGNLIPLPPTEIVLEKNTNFFDYEQKYMPGKALKYTPARCGEKIIKKIQETCINVMKILEFKNLARIDGFVCGDEIIIIDPNSLSGMSPSTFIFRQAAELNMSHTQLINHLIKTELTYYKMLEPIQNTKQTNNTNIEKKIKVGVLLGGKSNEKEISLESGRNVVYKLSPQKYEAIPIFVSNNLELFKIDQSLLVRNNTHEITESLKPEMKIKWNDLPKIIDFAFIGLHGGEGENGCIQGTLETLSIPYNGSSVLTSAICMNKFKTNEFLKSQGFDVPNHFLLSKKEYEEDKQQKIKFIEKNFVYPIIIKPNDDGCSVLVQKVNNQDELLKTIENIFNHGKSHVLIEEFIKGMELTVGVLGNNEVIALPASKVVSTKDVLSIEEKFLPGQGENQTPAPLQESSAYLVKKTVENIYKSLNCKGYARIDCFYQNEKESPTKKERIVVIEINTLPGLTPATCLFHQAAEIGIKPMDFIDLIIQLGFEEHSKNKIKELNQGNKIDLHQLFKAKLNTHGLDINLQNK